jgi:hypothetical protein
MRERGRSSGISLGALIETAVDLKDDATFYMLLNLSAVKQCSPTLL